MSYFLRSASFLSFLLLLASLVLIGCDRETRNITEPNKDPIKTLKPYGQISGHVINPATQQPVKGIVISVSYNGGTARSVTDDLGYYSITGVPVGEYKLINGQVVSSGSYPLTASCVSYNTGKSDSLKYRDHYFSNANVIFTTAVGSGPDSTALGIENMMAVVNFEITYLNTEIRGRVVDKENRGIGNAIVHLHDFSSGRNLIIQQTVSDAEGNYFFSKVDNGLSVMISAVNSSATMEGSLVTPFYMQYSIMKYQLRPEVATERLELKPVDSHSPYVTSILPEYGTDVTQSSDFTIVYNFSEPIKQSAYTRTDLPLGMGTFLDDINFTFDGIKKSASDLPFTLSWNSSFSQLSVKPRDILTSGKYTLDLRIALSNLKDAGNRSMVDNSSISGDMSEGLKFTINQGIKTSAVPVLISSGSVNYSGGSVLLSWSNYSDPNARSFNLYRSIDNQPYQLLSNIQNLSIITSTGPLIYPSSSVTPFRAFSAKYVVRAVSFDLYEGDASNVVEIKDNISPQIDTLTIYSPAQVGGDTATYLITLSFPEPMSWADVTNIGNYSLQFPVGLDPQIISVRYKGSSLSFKYDIDVTFSTSRKFKLSEFCYIICNNIKDLAGNNIDPVRNKFKIRGIYN